MRGDIGPYPGRAAQCRLSSVSTKPGVAHSDPMSDINMYEKQLSRLAERKLLRHLPLLQSATGPLVTINGKSTILMASNDYLGLATHPTVKEAAIEATKRYGVGTGASRLISGTQPP